MRPNIVHFGLFVLLSTVAVGQSSPAGGTAVKAAETNPTKPAYPGILTSSDPALPPPFIDPPGLSLRSQPVADSATADIPKSKKKDLDDEHGNWNERRGGKSFHANLHYAGGRPLLMLTTTSDEPAALKRFRLQAMVEACALHLKDNAFDSTVISIVELSPGAAAKPVVRNIEIRKDAFEAALKKIGKAGSATAAMAKIREDDSAAAMMQVCAELGLR